MELYARRYGVAIMAEETTTIQISQETWRRLNGRKEGPNDTFDDVLQRLLDETQSE